MAYIPNIPNNADDPRFGRGVSEAIRMIYERYADLEDHHLALARRVDQGLAHSSSIPAPPQPTQQVVERNIQSFQGQLNQPQLAQVTSYSSLPTTAMIGVDPALQDMALFRVGDQLYAVSSSSRSFIPLSVSATPQIVRARSVNITQVSVNANTTSDQDLMTYSLPASTLSVGQLIRITCYGNLDFIALATNITFKIVMTSPAPTTVTLLSFLPVTPTGPLTNIPFRLEAILAPAAIGASGNFEAHGWMTVENKTSAGHQDFPQLDLNTAVTSNVDLTVAETLKVQVSFNSASASNVARQRMMVVEY